jgi:4-nitrophenyl phosphatase
MKYDNFFLDMDGTISLNGILFDDICYYLNKLYHRNKAVYFLTNNTSSTKLKYFNLLKAQGVIIPSVDNIITPLDAFISYSIREKIQKVYYLLPDECIQWIQDNGGPRNVEDKPEIVVVGFDKELTYERLQKASVLINSGVPYFLTHIDLACPTSEGPIPDCGAIGKLIENVTQIKSKMHFGKPGDLMKRHILALMNSLQLRTSRSLFAGDRLNTDMELGKELGIDTLLIGPEQNTSCTYNFSKLSDFLKSQI